MDLDRVFETCKKDTLDPKTSELIRLAVHLVTGQVDGATRVDDRAIERDVDPGAAERERAGAGRDQLRDLGRAGGESVERGGDQDGGGDAEGDETCVTHGPQQSKNEASSNPDQAHAIAGPRTPLWAPGRARCVAPQPRPHRPQ